MTLNALKGSKTFLVWKLEPDKNGKLTKVPYSGITGGPIGTSAKYRRCFTDYEKAEATSKNYERGFDGVGFVFVKFTESLYICGVDVDKHGPDSTFSKDIIAMFPNAYIEASPSGNGIHIILLVDITRVPQVTDRTGKKKLAPEYYSKNPKNGVEAYVAGLTSRYFTFTEKTIQDGVIADQTDEFLRFLNAYMLKESKIIQSKEQGPKPDDIEAAALTDEEIIAKARNAANGAKFAALFDRGDIGGYGSQSNADLGLMNILAFYTRCDKVQMERLFSMSALGQRGKWLTRVDYREMTLNKAADDCAKVYEPVQRVTAGEDFTLKPGDYSDVGQAEVLAREYGGNLRFSEATDFISYNGVYWEECKPKAQGIAQELTRRQLDEARAAILKASVKLQKLEASDAAGKTKKEAQKSLKGAVLQAFMEYSAAERYRDYVVKERESKQINAALKEVRPMVLIDISDLDADPFLLNTPGATYDLRRGITGARPHRADDYITGCTAVSPSDEGAELWDKLLNDVFLGNKELIEYVQRVAGVCAVGKVFIEQLVISHGDGKNGKSTFWNPILKVFGSYSGSLSADALTAQCRHNVRPELAELRGKRAVLARELQEGKRLDESVLKKITSTDPIDAEKKYKSPFTFIPTHTPLMYTNFLPKIGSRDKGTQRRLCVVPFTAVFEGSADIKNYGDFLYEHAGGAILKWVIEGAKKVIDAGFHIELPECVRQATKEYIDAFDWLSKFLEARCYIGDGEREQSGALYNAYREHCDSINETYKRSAQDFNTAVAGAGFERVQPGGSKKPAFFQGLRLLTNAERDFDDGLFGAQPLGK
ncbi:MAG: DUF5906 domain-containing protein [Clostridiales bacterium]|jgi:P4 family phage/plasmid primase-like protien|nr:DUF5906 domain-containing protein [Clostridiales bacterium]